MIKRTKIVATISDKKCDAEFIRELYQEGVNVVRINSAHLNIEGALKIITNVIFGFIHIFYAHLINRL